MSADAKMSADLDQVHGAARADAEVDTDEAPEHDRPLSSAELERAQALSSELTTEGPPLLGARHDVDVKSTKGAVSCRCVDVLLGEPTMPQVQWEKGPPAIYPETQLFIALAPHSDCPDAPKDSDGSSYWGYRVQGNDVIVLLEAWRPEPKKKNRPVPPQTVAAIIPKPPEGGNVYVAPVSRDLPFGRPLDGKGTRCRIGNPGPGRTQPLTPGEVGGAEDPASPAD